MPKKDLDKIARDVKHLKDIESMPLSEKEKDYVHGQAKADAVKKLKAANEKKYGKFVTKHGVH